MIRRCPALTLFFLMVCHRIAAATDVATEEVQAPRRLPYAVISMLSPAISERHNVQKVPEDLAPPADPTPEAPHAPDLALRSAPVTQHNATQKEVAEKKAADDDELPMPSFAVEQPMGAKVLRGAEERELGVPPALDLQHPNLLLNSSTCMSVRKSNLVGAGDGCFAACDIPGGTLLGEYKGKTYMTSGKVPNDGAYTWKVPACDDATTVLTREDTEAWATCGNRNGFVYVDAAELNEKADNPMRYVNGAWSKQQRMGVNVDAVINDRRVYYFTSKTVSIGDELVIDYGPQYWAKDSSPPPPSPAPPMLNPASAHSFAAANVASKYEKEADEEAHSILADANKLGARLRAARVKAKVEQSASNEDAWADEREVDQGLTK